MTKKQMIFCENYLVDFNATKAALTAGYSKKTARSIGQENLTKPDIKKYIQERIENKMNFTKLTADAVIEALISIAFANITDFIKISDGALLLKPHIKDTYSVEYLNQKKLKGGTHTTIRLKDSLKALELLGKHLGIFDSESTVPKAKDMREKLYNIISALKEDIDFNQSSQGTTAKSPTPQKAIEV